MEAAGIIRGLSYALLEGGLGDPTRTKEEGLHTGRGGAAGGGRALPLAEGLWLPDSGGTLSCRLLQTKQSGSAAAYAGALGIVQISSLIETRSQAGVVLVSLSLTLPLFQGCTLLLLPGSAQERAPCPPPQSHLSANYVQVRTGSGGTEQGRLQPIVLLVTMTTMQSHSCCRGHMVFHPHVTFYSSDDPCETLFADGSFPKESLHLYNRVIHKENSEAYRTLTPEKWLHTSFH
ncbi:uncharacterized protein LOC143940673 [Lithobates pipiens]